MLHDKQLITVDSTLWEAIGERAERAQLSTEDWLRRQLHAGADRGEIREADFDAVRRRLCDEYDESGGRK